MHRNPNNQQEFFLLKDTRFDGHNALVPLSKQILQLCSRHLLTILTTYLDQLPSQNLGFFGTGALSRQLVQNHPKALRKHNVWFIESHPENDNFLGYPRIQVSKACDLALDGIILMSLAYEAEMIQACPPSCFSNIITLIQVCYKIDPALRRSILQEMIRSQVGQHIQEIDITAPKGKKIIAIVTPVLNIKHLKVIRGLRQSGFFVVLITEKECVNSDSGFRLIDFKQKGFFDLFFSFHEYYDLWTIELLNSKRFCLAHLITSTTRTRHLANIVANADCPIINDYDDIIEIVFEDDNSYQKYIRMPDEDITAERLAFKTLFKESDAIIQRHSPELIEILSKKHECRPRWIPFGPYPSERLFRNNSDEEDRGRNRTRIVFASGVVNNPESHNYYLFQSLFDAIVKLTGLGVEFTIYNGLDRTGEGFENIIEMAQKNPFFNYHFALEYDQLVEQLGSYDWGWHCMDFTGGAESMAYVSRGLSSKYFTYLEAGLPILISKDLAYECSLIEESGIGLGIRYEELHQLPGKLSKCNYSQMKQNVISYRKKCSMEKQLPRLCHFYDEIMNTSNKNDISATQERQDVK